MALTQKLDIKLGQGLVMTPQLQMAIKLLQMPMIDLNEFIDSEILENPFLQKDDGVTEVESSAEFETKTADTADHLENTSMDASDDNLALDHSWDNMYESPNMGASASGGSFNETDDSYWENTATKEVTLKDHLTTQLGEAISTPKELFIGHYLIDAIDDAGYMQADISHMAERLKLKEHQITKILSLIQTFEPAGVGARNLAECLRLQLISNNAYTEAHDVILDNLEMLARKEFGKLAKMAGISHEEIADLIASITGLNPKPGLKYGSDNASNVIPDVIIRKNEKGVWKQELNAEAMPKVLVNGGFSAQKTEEKQFINERMSRAQWLLKSLEQRARTIHKVAGAILEKQKDFFEFGPEYLQPLTLKDVAELVDVHESTVSRVTNGKYMQTPMGVFELKYFFSSAINTTGGQVGVASESVKQMIKRLIEGEDARKPLSDEKLVGFLKREGVDVARRTVAKYREAMNIPSTTGRRIRF